jgi:hypothetical protein
MGFVVNTRRYHFVRSIMKYSIILVILSLVSLPLYANNCRKEVKAAEERISQVDDILSRARDYFGRHEEQLNRQRIDLAKKFLDLGIERLETAMHRYQASENQILNLLITCSDRHKTLNKLLDEVKAKHGQTEFRLRTYQNIAARF